MKTSYPRLVATTLLCASTLISLSTTSATAQQRQASPQPLRAAQSLAWFNFASSKNPLAVIQVGEGKNALHFRCYKDGRVELVKSNGQVRAVAAAGKSAVIRDDGGKVMARISRPGTASNKERATLGVVVGEVPSALATHLDADCTDMVLVLDVKKGKAADKAGVRKHDIIFEVDGRSDLSQDKLAKIIEKKKPGQSVEIGVLRRGNKSFMKAKLGSQPARTSTYASPLARLSQTTPSGLYGGLTSGNNAKWRSPPTSGVLVDQNGRWQYLLDSRKDTKGLLGSLARTSEKKSAKPTTEQAILDLVEELRAQHKRVDRLLERLKKHEKIK